MTSRRWRVVAGVGLVLTALGVSLATWAVHNGVEARLDERADRVAAVLDLQLEQYRSASRALAAVRSDDPDLTAWVAQVQRLGVAKDLASVYSTAVATAIETGGQRQLVIDRVAPVVPNQAALGLDVLSVPEAAPAAGRALDEGLVSMSDALTLIQEPADQTGLAVYAPWYDDAGEVGGVTNLVVRGQDLLDALVVELGDVGVRVIDGETAEGPREVGVLVPAAGLGELSTSRGIEPLGQAWTVEVTASLGFASTTERFAPWLTLVGLLAVTGLVAALVDLLQRREEHAHRQVEARTAELVAANRELAAAVRAKDEFLAVVTHEFRTPITVIRGFAETAAAGRSGELPQQTQEWLDRIDQQARRLHALVDNVLTTAQLQTGELAVAPEVVDVGRLAAAVADQHPRLAPLEVTIPDQLLAEVDPGHFVRILDALLSNAAKYGQPPVTITAEADGDQVVVRVHDQGPGVSADLAPKVFAAFEQADRGDTRRSRGMGLGLSVVRELCERMGGTVGLADVASGACFEVRVPRANGLGNEAEEGPEVASPAMSSDEG